MQKKTVSRALTLSLGMLLAGAVPSAATSPLAEIICKPSHDLARKLTQQFRADRFAMGTQGPDQVMEVWTDDSGDWTLVVTYATGTSCIVAMGENWDYGQADNPA